MTPELVDKLISIIESTTPVSFGNHYGNPRMEFCHGLNRIELKRWTETYEITGYITINGNNPAVQFDDQEKAFVSSRSEKLGAAFMKRFNDETAKREDDEIKRNRERLAAQDAKLLKALE